MPRRSVHKTSTGIKRDHPLSSKWTTAFGKGPVPGATRLAADCPCGTVTSVARSRRPFERVLSGEQGLHSPLPVVFCCTLRRFRGFLRKRSCALASTSAAPCQGSPGQRSGPVRSWRDGRNLPRAASSGGFPGSDFATRQHCARLSRFRREHKHLSVTGARGFVAFSLPVMMQNAARLGRGAIQQGRLLRSTPL